MSHPNAHVLLVLHTYIYTYTHTRKIILYIEESLEICKLNGTLFPSLSLPGIASSQWLSGYRKQKGAKVPVDHGSISATLI